MQLSRRKLITGLISFAAAPAIVRIESLMPVKVMKSIDYNYVINKIVEPYINYWVQDGSFVHMIYMEENELKRKIINDYEFYNGEQWQLHQSS